MISAAIDRIALGFVKALRHFAAAPFARRCGRPAVAPETRAAGPGVVGAGVAEPGKVPAAWPHEPHWKDAA